MRALILNKYFLVILTLSIGTASYSQDINIQELMKEMFTFKRKKEDYFKDKRIIIKMEYTHGNYNVQKGSFEKNSRSYYWKYEDETDWRTSNVMKAYKFNNDKEAINQLRFYRIKKVSSIFLCGIGMVFAIQLPQEKQLTYAEGMSIGLPLVASGVYFYVIAKKAYFKSAEIFNSHIKTKETPIN